MKRTLNYTRCAVVCHGFSEYQIARYIKSNLHLKLEIFAREKGATSIQITSVIGFLSKKIYQNLSKFSEEYDVKYDKKNKKLVNFRLFVIMDTDDCTEKQKDDFMSKELFKGHPLYEYIYPISNVRNLEEVLQKAGISAEKVRDSEKGEYYLNAFPINNEPFSYDSLLEVKTLHDKLKPIKNTNMEEFLAYCISLIENN